MADTFTISGSSHWTSKEITQHRMEWLFTIEVRPGDSTTEAIQRATPGTAVRVKKGTYRGSIDLSGVNVTPDSPIMTLAPSEGEPDVVGLKTANAFSACAHYVTIYQRAPQIE